jgi:hypothetical protein
MWSPAADTIAFSANGAERLRVAAGTVSVTGVLNTSTGVVGNIASFSDGIAQTITIATGAGYAEIRNPNAGDIVFSNPTTRMTILADGNIGVGTSSPLTGAMTNNAVLNAGLFATVRGSVASTSGAAVTIAVANQNHAQATYIVSCGISSGAPAAFSAVAIVSADNNVLRVTTLQTAALMTISVSGTDIQATQASGGAANILYTLTRVA